MDNRVWHNQRGAMKRKNSPTKIGPILDDLLKGTEFGNRFQERAVLEKWPEVVGQRIAEHSTPIDLNNGILTIDADHAAWKQEITLMFPVIKDKFNELCGEGTVTAVRWNHRVTGNQNKGNHGRQK